MKDASWLSKATRVGAYNLKRLLKPEKYSKDFMHLVKNYNPIRSVGMKLFLIFYSDYVVCDQFGNDFILQSQKYN